MDKSNWAPRNYLLRSLSDTDLSLIKPKLERAALFVRRNLEEPDQPIREICFPEAGIISVVAKSGERRIETGLIGYEGMTGPTVVMGDDRSPHETYVQVEGEGLIMEADDLRAAMRDSPTLRDSLLRFVQAFMIQTAHTALANGRARIDERLARWLLMAQDRVCGDKLPLTHEFLSLMLGVRRPGVTDALHRLEGEGLIRAKRSLIMVRDRAGLVEVADGSYGGPEAEYRRLLGPLPAWNGDDDVGVAFGTDLHVA